MSEWPRNQEFNRIVISSSSPESVGTEVGCTNTGPASAVLAANLAIYVPFVVHQPFIALKMGVSNGTVVAGNVDVGIYDDQQNRLVSVGSTAQAGVSTVQEFDITDTTLRPGVYFMALNTDSATATFVRWTLNVAGAAPAIGVYNQAVGAVTLPATATFAASTGSATGAVPHMFVTGRTVL